MKGEKLERCLRALPRTLRPKRDLWPGIERSIREPAQSRLLEGRFPQRGGRVAPLLAVAASIALVAGALLLVLRQPSADGRTILLARVEEAERQYEKAKQELLRSLWDLAAEYGEAAVSGFEEEFAAVDREIAVVKAAVGQDGQELAYRLAVLYRSQASALERASSLVHSLADKEG